MNIKFFQLFFLYFICSSNITYNANLPHTNVMNTVMSSPIQFPLQGLLLYPTQDFINYHASALTNTRRPFMSTVSECMASNHFLLFARYTIEYTRTESPSLKEFYSDGAQFHALYTAFYVTLSVANRLAHKYY